MTTDDASREVGSSAQLGLDPERAPVRPAVWWREQRDAFEGMQTLAPMFLRGPEKPGSHYSGATYEPLYDQSALESAVAAERERCAKLCDTHRRSWPMDGPATADTIQAAIRRA